MSEMCNECGRSVARGTGLFVNRVLDCNSILERKNMGKPFPDGDFICVECDTKERFNPVYKPGDVVIRGGVALRCKGSDLEVVDIVRKVTSLHTDDCSCFLENCPVCDCGALRSLVSLLGRDIELNRAWDIHCEALEYLRKTWRKE